ncbi:unnamed protein product [Trichogramma brassicae]|uniref:Uncharacterized protein n=1 Tax=Trichogramma brassicae TaxID=86971 RepID=A0A6H5J3H1_9HYME|nr:unnamed protein product [Trichogramma brassicae]
MKIRIMLILANEREIHAGEFSIERIVRDENSVLQDGRADARKREKVASVARGAEPMRCRYKRRDVVDHKRRIQCVYPI